MFLGKGVLKICSKSTGEHPYRSAISIKLQSNFVEITLWHGCSSVNLLHIFRTSFLKNTSGWLLLVNDSLCPCYRGLWNECKKLWNNKKIYSYFTVNGTIRIKQVENGPYKSFTHVNDLRALFPEEQISMS